MKFFASIKVRILHRVLSPRHKQPDQQLVSSFAHVDMFSLYFRSSILFEKWWEVSDAVLLNMLRHVKRDTGLADVPSPSPPPVLVLKVSNRLSHAQEHALFRVFQHLSRCAVLICILIYFTFSVKNVLQFTQ